MFKVKRGNVARSHGNKILRLSKGFKGGHSRLFRTANGQIFNLCLYRPQKKEKKF